MSNECCVIENKTASTGRKIVSKNILLIRISSKHFCTYTAVVKSHWSDAETTNQVNLRKNITQILIVLA